jgi:hypothetical protein
VSGGVGPCAMSMMGFGGRLTCTLPHGHQGRHVDRDVVWWRGDPPHNLTVPPVGRLLHLDDNTWVAPEEVIAVHKNGSTTVELRNGSRAFPDCSVAEVIEALRYYHERGVR